MIQHHVSEVRVDPLNGLRVIVAGAPSPRADNALAVTPAAPVDPERDPFAEGHEDRTPPELYAVRPGGGSPDGPGWTVRVVPDPYDVLSDDGPVPPRDAVPDLFTALPARGRREVIVNAPQPVTSLAELPVEQVRAAVEVWRERMRAHVGAYPHLVVNERTEAGASVAHTHAQLWALDFVPAVAARERERFGAYAVRTMGGNLLEDLVQEEVRRRERIVAIDDEAVLMCPYASRTPFALMLAPRRRRERFESDGPTGAALLHDGLSRLRRRFGTSPPLNLWVRTAPRDADRFCWRIDIVPRPTPLAGLELGTGVALNPVAPEQAAAELRDA
jgi:UDPglucose--hexose-1-phosphate uridylyltransferase